jgi:hypothetical protein
VTAAWLTLALVCSATGPARADRVCRGVEIRAGSYDECRQQIAGLRLVLAGTMSWVMWQECKRET